VQSSGWIAIPVLVGLVVAAVAIGVAVWMARNRVRAAREQAARTLADAARDGENRAREIQVAAQEKTLAAEEELDGRERELDERESALDGQKRGVDEERARLAAERGRLERQAVESARARERALAELAAAETERAESRRAVERVAELTFEQARAEVLAAAESEARAEATRIARRIEEETRDAAEREAANLIVQATQRVNLRDVMESTVSFIELPSDEMKGRIIGKEGRNIRALEMATGIDLIVDDTPRSIWISCFDPVRREVARVAIDRLLEDGRIHPARIEEVVAKVSEEIDGLIDTKGNEAAFSIGISDLHPKLARLVGKARHHTSHGQNLLQHCLETAQIAGFLAQQLGGKVDVAQRAGLLHEVGTVSEEVTDHPILCSAELCARYGESEAVVHAVRSLHPEFPPRRLEELLVGTANKLSEARPGARKENLAVFIERLRRLENIATGFPGVTKAYAIKAGRELRVIVDTARTNDEGAYALSRQIARAIEREISYPGQIRVSVVRETRSVRFAV
jgi:ribonuclease Y